MTLKPRWSWLVPPLLVLLAWFAYGIFSSSPKLPGYRGKTYYQWAAELQKAQSDYTDPNRWKKIETTSAAIRAIGTNALPFVMADLRAHYTVKDRVIAWVAPRAKFLKLKPSNVADRWVRGIRAMEALGPLGTPYLPELITMVSNSTGYSEGALMAVGPDALPAFTNLLAHSKSPQTGNLIGAFANAVYANRISPEQGAIALPYLVQVFRSTDSHGRWYAAGALGAVHQDPDLCIPLLMEGLKDPTPSVRESSVQSLGAFGEAASAHAEKLAEAFDQVDPQTRRAICGALGNFRSAARVAVPVLVRGLQDRDENVRVWAATGLGQLASSPDESVPALAAAVEDPSRVVRTMVVQSLGLFGARATNVLTTLERACSDPDASVRSMATNAISRIKSAH